MLYRRIVGIDNKPFPGGDWVSDEPQVMVDGDNASMDIRALCKGDVLQSFIPDQVIITGKLFYDNKTNTPIYPASILLRYNENIIDTIQTDYDGAFSIPVKKYGSYTLIPQIKLPWSPVSQLNINAFLRLLVGLQNLTGLNLKAADINSSGDINSYDYYLLEMRNRSLNNTFPGGDWVTETPTVEIGNTDSRIEIKALLKGDILGIYSPVDKKENITKSIKTLDGERIDGEVIKDFTLEQNYPNPFNPETTIKYSVPMASNVQIEIYNTLGQKVDVLLNGIKEKGNYELKYNAGRLATGTYVYTIKATPLNGSLGYASSKKMIFIK